MTSKPAGTTRPAMKQAMAMFAGPKVDKSGHISDPKPPRIQPEMPGQRDVFDALFDLERQNLD